MRGRNYRLPKGQPYVRVEYIAGPPMPKITKFVMGNPKGKFQYRLKLTSPEPVQIRHNALEAARIAINKVLNDEIGSENYLLWIKPYPHVVLRENKMIATAGADRLQEGMRRAFGKPISRAARIKEGDPIIEVYTNREYLEIAKKALKIGGSKLPIPIKIEVQELPLETIET
ncbi:MAG: 50S ribosomal protein L16 [Candidatus Bathyarchaeia archaeon]